MLKWPHATAIATLVCSIVASTAGLVVGAAAPALADYYQVEGAELTSTTSLNAGSFGTSFVFLGKPFLVSVHIECSKVAVAGSIGEGGMATIELSLSTCTVSKPAHCTVKEPIVANLDAMLAGTSTVGVVFAAAGSSFATITLQGGSCSLKEEPIAVTGTQTCGLPGGETEAVMHEVACATTGSHLAAGGTPATLEESISGIELGTGAKWRSVRGPAIKFSPEPEATIPIEPLALTVSFKNNLGEAGTLEVNSVEAPFARITNCEGLPLNLVAGGTCKDAVSAAIGSTSGVKKKMHVRLYFVKFGVEVEEEDTLKVE